MKLDKDRGEATELFAKELWLDTVDSSIEEIGGEPFLNFIVTRNAPVYATALQRVQLSLPDDNLFKGRIGLELKRSASFPESIESSVLEGLIARTSRAISEGDALETGVAFVPFHNREENKVIQPATQLILGRRGVGKSTLIGKAVEVLRRRKNICVVVDLQAYALRDDARIIEDLFVDILTQMQRDCAKYEINGAISEEISSLLGELKIGKTKEPQAILAMKQIIKGITRNSGRGLFVFLDDFHLLAQDIQPRIISSLHGALKGAGGWLKIAGLTTLVRYYDPASRTGLQVPGDAQIISLDLTLTDPHAAETHLRSILANYLAQVGVSSVSAVISESPFRRLVWANAGVARDFLQMFSIALVGARRARRKKVALSDVNVSIGELGKQKISDLEQDTRNEADRLKQFLADLEAFCLDRHKINAFLIKEETTDFSKAIKILSDLRVIHLIHQSITPHKAGQRYEAYMLDYSLFVGFRRKRNIKEIHPERGLQFQVKELRKLPVFSAG